MYMTLYRMCKIHLHGSVHENYNIPWQVLPGHDRMVEAFPAVSEWMESILTSILCRDTCRISEKTVHFGEDYTSLIIRK